MVGQGGLEPPTSRLSVVRSNRLSYRPARSGADGGASRTRTGDPVLAKHVLSQLSYGPAVGTPARAIRARHGARRDSTKGYVGGPTDVVLFQSGVRAAPSAPISASILRKEVIQPQVPLRLPCYDFTPVADLTVAGCPPKVSAPSSGQANSHGVTGGVYKARERIHRVMLIRDY